MPDKFRKYKSLYSSTCNTFSTGESVTITPASVTGLPTDTEITLTFDRVDSSGTKTPDKMERIRGTVTGSNFVVSAGGRAVEGTEQVHTSPVVEMVWNADDLNDMVDGLLVEHGQDGKHTSALVTTLKASGAVVNTGTSDVTIVTPKALADSDYAKTSDITVTADSTTTFTNKKIEPRVVTAASYTTDTGTSLSVATCDVFQVTAQAGALKFNNPGGTPVAGQKLIIRVKDDGTARALTYDTQFRASSDLALPTTTVLGKTLYMGFMFNLTDTKWDLLAVQNNF